MTSPSQTSGGIETNSRGIAVIVVAVVVGFLLLLNAGGGAGASSDGGETATPPVDTTDLGDTSTTSQPDDLVTTTSTSESDDARDPGEVTVAVLNGGGPTGAAGAASDVIAGAGWNKGTVDNATNDIESTLVYFTEGYQPEANAVASLLGKSSDAVEAMPEEPLGPIAETDNVVVVLGADTPPVGEG